MVGSKKGDRYLCRLYKGLRGRKERTCLCKKGACLLERRHRALESQPRANDADAKDQAAAEAGAAPGFYDTIRSSAFFEGSETNASPGPLLPDRLVHRKPPQRNNWLKVVYGES